MCLHAILKYIYKNISYMQIHPYLQQLFYAAISTEQTE